MNPYLERRERQQNYSRKYAISVAEIIGNNQRLLTCAHTYTLYLLCRIRFILSPYPSPSQRTTRYFPKLKPPKQKQQRLQYPQGEFKNPRNSAQSLPCATTATQHVGDNNNDKNNDADDGGDNDNDDDDDDDDEDDEDDYSRRIRCASTQTGLQENTAYNQDLLLVTDNSENHR